MQDTLSGGHYGTGQVLSAEILSYQSDALQKLRVLCLDLPGVEEIPTIDKTYFKVGKRSFVIVETYHDKIGNPYTCLVFKASLLDRERLRQDPAYLPAPYVGEHGWLCRRIDGGDGDKAVNWQDIETLLHRSHRTIAGQAKHI